MTARIRKTLFAMAPVAVAFALCGLCGCDRIDDERIPRAPVNLPFANVGIWNAYGVGGAMEVRTFIRTDTERVPANFPYTVSMYTGFGGLMLVSDYTGNPLAYDLACPVECRRDVRVKLDTELNAAVCPVCHSVYSIFENYGHPISGIAADRGYGLTRYFVRPGVSDFYVITR